MLAMALLLVLHGGLLGGRGVISRKVNSFKSWTGVPGVPGIDDWLNRLRLVGERSCDAKESSGRTVVSSGRPVARKIRPLPAWANFKAVGVRGERKRKE